MMSEEAGLLEALSRLEEDIAEAEASLAEVKERLARLQAMRDNIKPFIEQYVTKTLRVWGGDGGRDVAQDAQSASGSTYVDKVVEVFRHDPDETFDVDDVVKVLEANGSRLDRVTVRNSINYAVRLGKVHRASRRGTYTLRDTSTPVAPGVEVNEELVSSSSREEGEGRDDTSALLHDQGGGAQDAQIHLGRAGDRAPIEG